MQQGSENLVHVTFTAGHRKSYQVCFSTLFDLTPSTGKISFWKWRTLVSAKKLLFATVDDDYIGFVMVAIARSIMGRQTVALYLSALQCLTNEGIRSTLKYLAFSALRRVPKLTILTIVPFDVEPRLAKVANDWVHDPQLWDVSSATGFLVPKNTLLSKEVQKIANRRPVLCFLGRVSNIKGFDFLTDLVVNANSFSQRFQIVVAGQIEDCCRSNAQRIEKAGGIIVDRFITDVELISLYGIADLVWCCYSPNYDNPSGIFGRAVQFGCCPIIRAGSTIEYYYRFSAIPPIVLDYGDAASAATRIYETVTKLGKPIEDNGWNTSEWKNQFVRKISNSL